MGDKIAQSHGANVQKAYIIKGTSHLFAVAHYVRFRENLQAETLVYLILPLPEMMNN
jgi:hypothetical protein